MNEREARDWLARNQNVSRETLRKFHRFVDLLIEENERQNLLSRSTLEAIWARHVVDSAQLAALAPLGLRWLDIGSGAGLPGVIIALLGPATITLCEPRRRRAEFLVRVADALGLANCTVVTTKVQSLQDGCFDVVTARAVAPLAELFGLAEHLAGPDTLWLLPKGRAVEEELALARRQWQGRFELVCSVTDPDGRIVVAEGVGRTGR